MRLRKYWTSFSYLLINGLRGGNYWPDQNFALSLTRWSWALSSSHCMNTSPTICVGSFSYPIQSRDNWLFTTITGALAFAIICCGACVSWQSPFKWFSVDRQNGHFIIGSSTETQQICHRVVLIFTTDSTCIRLLLPVRADQPLALCDSYLAYKRSISFLHPAQCGCSTWALTHHI